MKFKELLIKDENLSEAVGDLAIDEYKSSAKTVDVTLKKIIAGWKKMKTKLEKQLKKDKDNWEGIGDGFTLGDLKRDLENIDYLHF